MESTLRAISKDDEILDLVPDRWRAEFGRFLRYGEASNEFLDFLDTDPEGQRAVDMALAQRAAGFDKFTSEVKVLFAPKKLPERMANDLSNWAVLPDRKQKQVAEEIRESLKSLEKPYRERLKALLGEALPPE
jgi:hypothetical protein